MSYHRYVALGDSFTEGVGDPDPKRPNGLRGWADRVAEVLAAAEPDFGSANTAIRGRTLRGVLNEQLEPVLEMKPDLVTIYAGANDILRPKVDLDALIDEYDAGLGKLAASGAKLLVFTAFDPGGSAIYRPLRGRFALYNELVRTVAARHDSTIVDFWRLHEHRDWRYWDTDRMHMGPIGHQRIAIEVLKTLGVPHSLRLDPMAPLPVPGRREQIGANAAWSRTFLAPWLHRRLTGRSSGDSVSAKRPALAPIDPASA